MLQQVIATGAVMAMGGDMPMAAMSTPVEPGESLVMAVVRVRWQFVSASR